MKQRNSRSGWAVIALLFGLAMLPAWTHAQVYEVTVTNLTHGQIFSPPVVFSHRSSYDLFVAGQPAVPELAGVAEDANNGPLVALLTAEPAVADVSVGGDVILPGHSMTLTVAARGSARNITALGMLVTTNDAFFAAEKRVTGRTTSTYALAWDAGSEANTQNCAHIPGPPCMNPGQRVENGAEGYVYVHAGIQARGSLDPAIHDWRNPVAKITIRRANQ